MVDMPPLPPMPGPTPPEPAPDDQAGLLEMMGPSGGESIVESVAPVGELGLDEGTLGMLGGIPAPVPAPRPFPKIVEAFAPSPPAAVDGDADPADALTEIDLRGDEPPADPASSIEDTTVEDQLAAAPIIESIEERRKKRPGPPMPAALKTKWAKGKEEPEDEEDGTELPKDKLQGSGGMGGKPPLKPKPGGKDVRPKDKPKGKDSDAIAKLLKGKGPMDRGEDDEEEPTPKKRGKGLPPWLRGKGKKGKKPKGKGGWPKRGGKDVELKGEIPVEEEVDRYLAEVAAGDPHFASLTVGRDEEEASDLPPGHVPCEVWTLPGTGGAIEVYFEDGSTLYVDSVWDQAALAVAAGVVEAPDDWDGRPSTLPEDWWGHLEDITSLPDEYLSVAEPPGVGGEEPEGELQDEDDEEEPEEPIPSNPRGYFTGRDVMGWEGGEGLLADVDKLLAEERVSEKVVAQGERGTIWPGAEARGLMRLQCEKCRRAFLWDPEGEGMFTPRTCLRCGQRNWARGSRGEAVKEAVDPMSVPPPKPVPATNDPEGGSKSHAVTVPLAARAALIAELEGHGIRCDNDPGRPTVTIHYAPGAIQTVLQVLDIKAPGHDLAAPCDPLEGGQGGQGVSKGDAEHFVDDLPREGLTPRMPVLVIMEDGSPLEGVVVDARRLKCLVELETGEAQWVGIDRIGPVAVPENIMRLGPAGLEDDAPGSCEWDAKAQRLWNLTPERLARARNYLNSTVLRNPAAAVRLILESSQRWREGVLMERLERRPR